MSAGWELIILYTSCTIPYWEIIKPYVRKFGKWITSSFFFYYKKQYICAECSLFVQSAVYLYSLINSLLSYVSYVPSCLNCLCAYVPLSFICLCALVFYVPLCFLPFSLMTYVPMCFGVLCAYVTTSLRLYLRTYVFLFFTCIRVYVPLISTCLSYSKLC